MRYRAEACFIDTEDVVADLGHFETATEARSACASYEGAVLWWEQPWAGIWQAQGKRYWYRVVSEAE
ncbi:hypothetical protein [Deinococcus sp. UYEF24]